MERPSFEQHAMEFARLAATRGTCDRAQVGAVLTKQNRILATGYNGAPSKQPHCSEAGHLMVGGSCLRGDHAEISALLFSAKYGVATDGAKAFITHLPCFRCLRSLVSAGISEITYEQLYFSGLTEAVYKTILDYCRQTIILKNLDGIRFENLKPTFKDGFVEKLEV